MNVPNLLTLFRLVLVVPLVIAFELSPVGTPAASPLWADLALACFVLASVTDWLDGYLARKWNQTSPLGALLDPLADKVLVSSALVELAFRGVVPAWTALVVVGREFLITGLRVAIAERGLGIKAAAWSGKVKATLQMVAIALYLWPGSALEWPADVVYGLALLLTVTSGAEYVWQSRSVFSK